MQEFRLGQRRETWARSVCRGLSSLQDLTFFRGELSFYRCLLSPLGQDLLSEWGFSAGLLQALMQVIGTLLFDSVSSGKLYQATILIIVSHGHTPYYGQ